MSYNAKTVQGHAISLFGRIFLKLFYAIFFFCRGFEAQQKSGKIPNRVCHLQACDLFGDNGAAASSSSSSFVPILIGTGHRRTWVG